MNIASREEALTDRVPWTLRREYTSRTKKQWKDEVAHLSEICIKNCSSLTFPSSITDSTPSIPVPYTFP